jgi:hypothetical protein
MKRYILKFLLWLYPSAWRQRYGAEYLTLLEETAFTWGNCFDSLRGAVDVFLHPEWTVPGRTPMNQKRIFRFASSGALLSALLLVAGITSVSRLPEDAAEFLLLLSPVTLLPMVIALHFIYRPVAPKLSKGTAVIGLLGIVPFLASILVGSFLSFLRVDTMLPPVWVGWLFMSLITLIGVWLMLAAYLGWRTRKLPSGVPAIMGMSAWGWSVIVFGIFLNSQGIQPLAQQFSTILGMGLALWIITHPVWTVWLGIWFWLRPRAELPDKLSTQS